MPWQVPITVDGLEYPVTFNTEEQPTQQDLDEAVQQILSQRGQALQPAQPAGETPGYLSQLGSALGLGYRQMKSGVGATFNALTGDTEDVAAEMAEQAKLQREQQAAQTPQDIEFMRRLDEAEKAYELARGPVETISALSQYPAAAFAEPGAAFKTAVQSAPNVLISGATSLAGYGLGGLVGGAATLETGPGAILGGIAGAAAGGALSNTLMEAGPSIFDALNEKTNGAAANMTAEQISAFLKANPDVIEQGLKTGAIRGSVIGAVEALGVKGSGRLLTMPERAAARAAQKTLVDAGVDVTSKKAVDAALLDPTIRSATKTAAEAAKSQFSSAGNLARMAGASAIETGAAGAGELAAQAAAGQDISTKEAFMEMLGEAALSAPMAAATKAVEGAKYALTPSQEAEQPEATQAEPTVVSTVEEPPSMLPFTREDIRATQLPFGREDIRATELPFSRQNIRGLSMIQPEIAIAQNAIAATQNVPFTDVSGQAAEAIIEQNNQIASQPAIQPEQAAKKAGAEVTPSPDQLATVEEPWQIKGREWVKKQQANLGKWASDLDRSMNQNVDSVISSGQSFFGDFVDKDGNIDDGKLSAYREIFRSKGKDLVLEKPIGNLDKWKKSGVKNFPVVDFAQPQTPFPAMEMPEKPSQTITGSNAEMAAEMPVQPVAGGAPIPQQTVETQEDATREMSGKSLVSSPTNELSDSIIDTSSAGVSVVDKHVAIPAQSPQVGFRVIRPDLIDVVDSEKARKVNPTVLASYFPNAPQSGNITTDGIVKLARKSLGNSNARFRAESSIPAGVTLEAISSLTAYLAGKSRDALGRAIIFLPTGDLGKKGLSAGLTFTFNGASLEPTGLGTVYLPLSGPTVFPLELLSANRATIQNFLSHVDRDVTKETKNNKDYANNSESFQESVRQEPQDGVESREAEEAGVGDQLLRPATSEVEEEVVASEKTIPQPSQEQLGQMLNFEDVVQNFGYMWDDQGGGINDAQREHNAKLQKTWSDALRNRWDTKRDIPESDLEKLRSFGWANKAISELRHPLNKPFRPVTTNISATDFDAKLRELGVPKKERDKILQTTPGREFSYNVPAGRGTGRARSGRTGYAYERDAANQELQKAWSKKSPLATAEKPTPATEGMVTPGGVASERGIKPQKVGNVAAIPTPEEEARWKAVDDFTTPYVASLSDDALDSLGSKVGVKRNGVADDAYRAKILGNTHPDDLLDAIPDAIPQTTAAETQTPVPLREGTGAAGVVQSEPSGGSIPEVAKVSTETETASSGNLSTAEAAMSYLMDDLTDAQKAKWTPEMFAAAKTYFDGGGKDFESLQKVVKFPRVVSQAYLKADKAASEEQARIDKAQRATDAEIAKAEREEKKLEAEMLKREEMRSKAIDSLIGASEKKKRKFGQVTNSDAIAAVAMLVSSKDVPGVLTTWVGTKEDFLRDPANQLADPEIYARIKAGELVEGFFNKGRAYVFLDGVGVSENDMLRGEQMDVSPQIAAVRRVLLHESLVHRGIHGLPLRHRRLILNWVRQNSTPAELDDLAKLYTEYANWRNSDYEFEALAEELLAKKVDSLTEIPKDGPMAKLMDILRQIWDFIVGYKREPTLSDLKSVVKLLKSGAEALSNDTLKDGGQVKLSMIAPTAGITPEMDAEYLAAVEAGDMEKAQRMVDEAAKAAGYNMGPVWHGSPNKDFTTFDRSKIGTTTVLPYDAPKGFYFAKDEKITARYGPNKIRAFVRGPFMLNNTKIVVVESPNQIKSADPVTRDDAGNVIPLSQRFQPTSSDIRFSRPQFASDYTAAQSAGGEAARSTLYSERDMDIREAIRRAYEAIPKTNSVAVPIGELFAKTEELMPGVTQDEFSNVLQDLFEDNGAVLQEGESDFFVTTPEGRRAGFVVVMPRAAKASKIPIEDAVDVSKSFKADLAEAGRGRVDTKAKFKGKLLKDTEIPEHNVKSYPLYRNGAIKLIDDLMAKTNDILAVAESLQDPEFQMAVGLQVSNDVSSEMITIARSQIGFDIGRRLTDAIKNEKNPRRKRELELAKKKGIIYYNAGTGAGQALQNRQESMDDPLYKGQIIFDQAELQKDKKAKEKLDAITGGTEKITDIITGAEQKAAEETTQAEVEAQESAAEDDEYAKLVSEGEAELTNEEKGLWERAKMLLRRFAMYAKRKGARAANAAKASLSAEQRKELDELNAIMQMSDEEAAKAESKDRAEFAAVLKKLLGEEKPNDTPQQKKTRQKRVKMIDVVRRYVESGKPIDLSDQQTALKGMLREMNKARPADSVPLERAMPWRKILSSKPKDVAEYRQRILEAVSSIESFQNLTEEQKERLADLYAEAWEERRQAILDRMLRDEIKKARDRDEISDDVEKKLQQSRNKILEIINLGGFNNGDLVKILGERYGISTSFTEEQKARIQKLADQLQDEDMNTAKRNKLAMEFAVELAGAMDVPVTEIIANWWTSSVLFGPQTIFSIGAAFLNGGYSITTIGTRRMLAKLFKGDVQGSLEESILMLKGIARYLGAFKQAGRRAWNYLWSGDVGLLGIGSNDILSEISNFEQLQKFQRHKLLAEQLAKDPKRVRRYVGIYLRFVSRLLTALDAFNVMVTKAGTASLALRMSGMSTENIIKAEKMLNLKAYKDQVIRDYFDNKAPKTQAEKSLVDSYAEAEMYRAIDKMGGKMENADFLASESAMTMHPTGFGGVIYDAITGFFAQRQANADEYLEKMKKDWVTRKDLTSVTFLALAYLRQFAAYNAAGLTGSKFVRYASNKFNQGLSFIPFAGLLRQLEAKDDRIKGKDAFIETIYRNQVIGALMLFIGGAVLGAIEDEPDDEERGTFWNGGWANLTPDQKKQLLAKGQKEYTMGFKYNGRWYVFNYQNWPLNQVLSAIGSMSDQIRFSPKQWNEKNLLSKTVAGMVSGVKSTLEIPALSGLQELVGNRLASKDPTEQSLDRISRVASGWVGGFVPRILKDIDFATQPELRKYETLWEKTASHIPIYRRYVGEEYYDILGKPIKRNVIPGSREFMMGPTEPEYKILGALNSRNIFLTPANAEYRMVGKGRNRRRLTQEEADAYSLETGKGYRQMLLRYGQRALQMPTERARAFLSDKADEVRDRALKKVYRGYTK